MVEGREDLVSIDENPARGGASLASDVRGWRVIAGDGTSLGQVADVLVDRAGGSPRFLAVALDPSVARVPGGRRVYVPFAAARLDDASRAVHLDAVTGESAPDLPARPTDEPLPALDAASASVAAGAPGTIVTDDEVRVTLSEEELMVEKRTVSAGEVRVEKKVETEHVRRAVPVMREDVTVERRPLPPGAGLEPRVEGDEIHVPIVEEELVIEKRLVAREELVIRKRRVETEKIIETDLRRETPRVVGPGEDGTMRAD